MSAPVEEKLELRKSDIQALLVENTVHNIRQLYDGLSKFPPNDHTSITFVMIGNAPVKMTTKVRTAYIGGNAAVATLIEDLTEADVEEAMALTENYDERVRLRTLLNFIRQRETEREPLKVEIINPGAIGADKIMTIKRGDDGKMTGAVSVSVGG